MKEAFKFPIIKTKVIAAQLGKAAERAIISGHPWVYEKSIVKLKQPGLIGDLIIIYQKKSNKLLAAGLYDPHSIIRIKILSLKTGVKLKQDFFKQRIASALAKRQPLFEITNAYRLIYGENDFLPGLIVDIYNDVAVIKIYSAIWFPYLELISNTLNELIQLRAQLLRFSRQVNEIAKQYQLAEGTVISGALPNPEVIIHEQEVQFKINVIKGHKTGFFLDHRRNRIHVGELADQKTVLDVFCYAGGFSAHAITNGATEVVSIDISKQAIEVAKANIKLNNQASKHTAIAGDAFEVMQKLITQKKKFDLIVIDPPSFAKSKSEIPQALKQYERLAGLGSQLIGEKGILFLASCSSKISRDFFIDAIEKGLNHSNRRYSLWMERKHDIDHPVVIKESTYLKCFIYRFD